MATTNRVVLALGCLLLASSGGYSEPPPEHHAARLQLTPALTDLLRREMAAVQGGMQALLPAIASGDWQTIAETGENIRHSYLMDQQLTDAQRAELHQSLPPAFLELDQSFHRSAGRLAHAAQLQDAEMVSFYYYKLVDACLACHGRFAGHRFAGLSAGASNGEHQH